MDRHAEDRAAQGPAAGALKPLENDVRYYREKLHQVGADPSVVDGLVEAMLAAPQEFETLAPALRDAANALDWYYDQDYAAVALQSAAKRAPEPGLRHKMLSLAHVRASWCASCSTSGGEGTARSRHVRQLEDELRTGPQILAGPP
jgi:uncharacterized protein (DUF1330 family)